MTILNKFNSFNPYILQIKIELTPSALFLGISSFLLMISIRKFGTLRLPKTLFSTNANASLRSRNSGNDKGSEICRIWIMNK